MIKGQGEDSCRKNASDEKAHRSPKPESGTEISCGVTRCSAHVFHLFIFRLDSFRYVSTSSFME
ncbi:hypothetical protein GFV16_23185 [Bacillus megaterium]|nr:hypothetical protein [Priestia megaterium]